jgi:hypothetical protein
MEEFAENCYRMLVRKAPDVFFYAVKEIIVCSEIIAYRPK